MEGLLVTGDFMEITGATRNTLIHYDETGILKPLKTNERGDRFYHPFQTYTYKIIKMFQASGMSLASIKVILSEKRKGSMREMFPEHSGEMLKGGRQIDAARRSKTVAYRYLKKLGYVSSIFNLYGIEKPPVVSDFNVKGYARLTQADTKCSMSDKEFYQLMVNHIMDYADKIEDDSFPVITYFDIDDFVEGKNMVEAVGSFTRFRSDCRIEVEKAVIVRRKGSISSIYRTFEEIRLLMKKEKLIPSASPFILTNSFYVDTMGQKYADRLFVVPVRERIDGDGLISAGMQDERDYENTADIRNLLSSGEYIKTMHITRNSLNFYMRKGLIEPAYTKENGYNMYGIAQIYSMMNIKSLKRAGFSIQEIVEIYQRNAESVDNYEEVMKTIEDKIQVVKDEIIELMKRKYTMRLVYRWFNIIKAVDTKDTFSYTFTERERFSYRKASYRNNLSDELRVRDSIYHFVGGDDGVRSRYSYPVGMVLNRDMDVTREEAFIIPSEYEVSAEDTIVEGEYMIFSYVANVKNFRSVVKQRIEEIEADGKKKVYGEILNIFIQIYIEKEEGVSMYMMTMLPLKDL